jgi:hypothetical protein
MQLSSEAGSNVSCRQYAHCLRAAKIIVTAALGEVPPPLSSSKWVTGS